MEISNVYRKDHNIALGFNRSGRWYLYFVTFSTV